VDMELDGGRHELPCRSVQRDSEALESPSFYRIGKHESHVLLRARLPGELPAAVSGNPFIGVAGRELIEFAAETVVAVIAHAIECRRATSEAAKPQWYDMLDPAEPGPVRLRAINAALTVRHAIHFLFRSPQASPGA
jgi:hypothetical protein